MTARIMDTRPTDGKAGTPESSPKTARWGGGKSNPVARALARESSYSEHTIEHLLRAKSGLNIRCAELIKALRAHGDEACLERFFEPIRRAYENKQPEALTLRLVESVHDALHAEDIAELRALETKGAREVSLELRALDGAIARLHRLREAFAEREQELLRGQA